MKIPAPNPDVAQMIGKTIEIVLANGKQGIYLAVGPDALVKLKQAIATPADNIPAPAVAGTVRLRPIFDKLKGNGATQNVEETAKLLAGLKPGADEVTLESTAIGDGITLRLEINEGVLKTIGKVIMSQMPSGPSGPGGPPPSGFPSHPGR